MQLNVFVLKPAPKLLLQPVERSLEDYQQLVLGKMVDVDRTQQFRDLQWREMFLKLRLLLSDYLQQPFVEKGFLPLCSKKVLEVMFMRVAAEDKISLLLKPVEDELRKSLYLELLVLVFPRISVKAVEELQEVVFLLVLDGVRNAADGLELLDRFCLVEISVEQGFHVREERLVKRRGVKAALFEGEHDYELLVEGVGLEILFVERNQNLEHLQQGTGVENRLLARLARLDRGYKVPLIRVVLEAVGLGVLAPVEGRVAQLDEHFG